MPEENKKKTPKAKADAKPEEGQNTQAQTPKDEHPTELTINKAENQLAPKEFFALDHIKKRVLEAYQNEELARKALSCMTVECTKNPTLSKCTKISILQALLDAAHFGLVPNRQAGHAYPIPYRNKHTKQQEAQLIIGYKGYIKKFDEEGWNVEVELVSKKEVATERFVEVRGTRTEIMHRPLREEILTEKNIALAYAIAKKVGREPIPVVMTIDEILEAAKTQIWQDGENGEKGKYVKGMKGVWKSEDRETDFGQMCKKTVIRRLASVAPVETISLMHNYEGQRDMKDVTPEDKKPTDKLKDIMEQEKRERQEAKEPEGKIIEGQAIHVHEMNTEQNNVQKEPINEHSFDLKAYRLSIHGTKGRKEFTTFEEARDLLAVKMEGFKTRHDRQRIIDENKPLIDAMDKADVSLSTKLFTLRNEGN